MTFPPIRFTLRGAVIEAIIASFVEISIFAPFNVRVWVFASYVTVPVMPAPVISPALALVTAVPATEIP